MSNTTKIIKIATVCIILPTLMGCGYINRINPLSQSENVNAAISSSTLIPFEGDYQTAHDLVVKNAKSCFSASNQVVKALQLSDGMPAQIDIFDRGSSPAEPLPADLRIKAFMEPKSNGGQVKIDTFSASGEYGHQKSVERFQSWLGNQTNC